MKLKERFPQGQAALSIVRYVCETGTKMRQNEVKLHTRMDKQVLNRALCLWNSYKMRQKECVVLDFEQRHNERQPQASSDDSFIPEVSNANPILFGMLFLLKN